MREFFFIPCTIEQGGFSSERAFEIRTADGGKLLVGTANFEYLRNAKREELDEDTPGYGEKLSGYVMCRKVREIDEANVLVEVPSSDLIHVPLNELLALD